MIGSCGYGARCRFNHPRDRSAPMGAMRAGGGDYPERVGQPVCQHYMRTGTCKFGSSCKYHHPRQGGGGSQAPVNLNIYRVKECSYYVKTGQCKFGVTCKFHHPQPAGVQMPPPPPPPPVPAPAMYPSVQSPAVQSSQQYGVVAGNWSLSRPALLPGSYLPGAYGPILLPPGMVPLPSWTSYPAPVSPVAAGSTQPTMGAGRMKVPAPGLRGMSLERKWVAGGSLGSGFAGTVGIGESLVTEPSGLGVILRNW